MVKKNRVSDRWTWNRKRPAHSIGEHAPTGPRSARAKPSQEDLVSALKRLRMLGVFLPYLPEGKFEPETKLDRVLGWLFLTVYALIPVIVGCSLYFLEGFVGARWGIAILLAPIGVLVWWTEWRRERREDADGN